MTSQALPVVSNDVQPIVAKKPPVDPSMLAHKDLRRGPFWQKIPAYRNVDEAKFLDHNWQAKNSITKVAKLVETIQDLVPAGFIEDLEAGMKRAPMSVRVSPYLVSLIDWERPYEDPERIQFFPVASRLLPDHPKLDLDSLHEQADAPVPGLTHRYNDKALFLPLDTCPVYCRFCTRSYAIGLDTDEVEKVHLRPNEERWKRAYQYIASRPELEDIVICGGDAYQLRAQHIEEIGEALLAMPNMRRMRFATKGPAVMPHEDPHRRRVGRRAHRASSRRAASSTRTWCSTRTSTTPARSPASPRPRWASSSSAASWCATSPCSSAA